jgi:hypothetical protein
MLWTTSAYFHTVPEKIAGYRESIFWTCALKLILGCCLIVVGLGAVTMIHLASRTANIVAPEYFPRHS